MLVLYQLLCVRLFIVRGPLVQITQGLSKAVITTCNIARLSMFPVSLQIPGMSPKLTLFPRDAAAAKRHRALISVVSGNKHPALIRLAYFANFEDSIRPSAWQWCLRLCLRIVRWHVVCVI